MTFYYGKNKPVGAYDVEKIIITKVDLFDGENYAINALLADTL